MQCPIALTLSYWDTIGWSHQSRLGEPGYTCTQMNSKLQKNEKKIQEQSVFFFGNKHNKCLLPMCDVSWRIDIPCVLDEKRQNWCSKEGIFQTFGRSDFIFSALHMGGTHDYVCYKKMTVCIARCRDRGLPSFLENCMLQIKSELFLGFLLLPPFLNICLFRLPFTHFEDFNDKKSSFAGKFCWHLKSWFWLALSWASVTHLTTPFHSTSLRLSSRSYSQRCLKE